MSLRVMTWNVHGMRGRDGRHDPERVARVLDDARIDVAGLQEVGALGRTGELADPAGTLARLTGLTSAYGLTELRGGFPYGNCILARHLRSLRERTRAARVPPR
jgi:endonuclease/exonuclease/phosphatase family metal-dependent hydrolase